MNLRVKPNDETGLWDVHDECGFFCKLESESTAALIVHAVNVLPQLVDFLHRGKYSRRELRRVP